jgi:hypothetical protein
MGRHIINISNYESLLISAAQQPEPQRLLFVFAKSELPEDHSEAEAQSFFSGQGGSLNPVMYVDKTLNELGSFSDLVTESKQMGQHWHIVFVAALAGRNSALPSSAEAQAALDMMVKSVQQGIVSNFLAYDRDGIPVHFAEPVSDAHSQS